MTERENKWNLAKIPIMKKESSLLYLCTSPVYFDCKTFYAAKKLQNGIGWDSQLENIYKTLELESDVHKNVVRYMDRNTDDCDITIYLEYTDIGSLSKVLRHFNQPLDEHIVRKYMHDTLEGLQAFHKRQIGHGSFSGATIMLSKEGVAKLDVCGICKLPEATTLENEAFHNMMWWKAPEHIVCSEDQTPTTAGDIWSVGCTVIEILNGGLPPWFDTITKKPIWVKACDNNWKEEAKKSLQEHVAKCRPPLPQHLSDEVKNFIRTCCRLKPEDRPTAAEILKHPFITGMHVSLEEFTKDESTLSKEDYKQVTTENPSFPDSSTGQKIAPLPIKEWHIDQEELLWKTSIGSVYSGLGDTDDRGKPLIALQLSMPCNFVKLQEQIEYYRTTVEHSNLVQYLGMKKMDREDQNFILSERYMVFTDPKVREMFRGGSVELPANWMEDLIKGYIKGILEGLSYLHMHGIYHWDISSGNIAIGEGGKAMLLHYGICQFLPIAQRITTKYMWWLPPEVFNISNLNDGKAVDIWGIGCTVIELLNGGLHPWFDKDTKKPVWVKEGDSAWEENAKKSLQEHVAKSRPPLPQHLSDEAKNFIRTCCRLKPEDRPTAAELLKHPFITGDKVSPLFTDSAEYNEDYRPFHEDLSQPGPSARN